MKKIIFYTIIAALILGACNEEEFLKENPKDDIFAENLYVNYDGFQNGIYGLMGLVVEEISNHNNARTFIWKVGVDNGFGMDEVNSFRPFNNYTIFNSENGDIAGTFSWLYEIINSANMIIGRAENPDVDWMGQSESESMDNKDHVVATARLIRAWAYRHLTNSWGDVPLTLEEISGSNYRSDWERTPITDVQKVMEEDLIFARDHLALVEETGFPNSAVASHYLAELYLLQGKFDASITESSRVINSGNYSLMTQRFGKNADKPGVVFRDLFDNDSRENGNLEVLWTWNNAYETVIGSKTYNNQNLWVSYATKDSKLKKLDANIFWKYNQGRGRSRCAISDAAFDWYEPADDRFSEYIIMKYCIFPKNAAETEFDTVAYTSTKFKGDEPDDVWLWPWTLKYSYVDLSTYENHQRPPSFESEMYLRLADTYLLLAEAQLKNNDKDAAALALNTVRLRSHASPITAADVNIDFILKERSRELITEEHRRYTLNRNNKLVEWTVMYNPRVDAGEIAEHNVLFPIPQGIIDANTGAPMQQNPGYAQ